MYNAYITRIRNLRKHTNADRLLCGECFGNTVIVDLNTQPNELGIYFPVDGRLGLEYALKNDLLRRKDENGNPAGGYLDPEKRNIRAMKLADGTMCCDFGGQRHEPGVEQCPTTIFNWCQACGQNDEPVPETLTWCRQHYVPPVQKYITCDEFGHSDGTNGGCWWCMEMTPYQWHMCQDESWVRSLLSPIACRKKSSRAEAITFIEQYKQRTPMGNERRALVSDRD